MRNLAFEAGSLWGQGEKGRSQVAIVSMGRGLDPSTAEVSGKTLIDFHGAGSDPEVTDFRD